jgi:NAD(P)-dependent dehydrogenase (short-subunit alcohol dehydrogenase family)
LYQQSKLANVLFSFELQKRYGDQGLISYSLHPGAVVTELGRHFNQYLVAVYKTIGPYLMKTAVEGAQTNIYAALVDPKDAAPGHYLADCTVSEHNKLVTPELQKKLWELSEQVIATK